MKQISKEEYQRLYNLFEPWEHISEEGLPDYYYETELVSEGTDFTLYVKTQPDLKGDMFSVYFIEE